MVIRIGPERVCFGSFRRSSSSRGLTRTPSSRPPPDGVERALPSIVSAMRALTLLALLAVACASPGDLPEDARPERKNVLFLIADDLSASALACYGNEQVATPNLDRLARRGVRFTRAYCQYPVCGPSRAALMSGLYPQRTGVLGNGGARRLGEALGERPTLGEHFIDHGYYSARVGKIYHMRVPGDITAGVDGPDHAASWTERYNCPGPEWMTAGEHEALSNETLSFEPEKHYDLGFGTAFYTVRASAEAARQPDALAADKAIELLREHGERPFFLAVGFWKPHAHFNAPKKYWDMYDRAKIPMPAHAQPPQDVPDLAMHDAREILRAFKDRPGGKPNDAETRALRHGYFAATSFVDGQVGNDLDVALRTDAAVDEAETVHAGDDLVRPREQLEGVKKKLGSVPNFFGTLGNSAAALGSYRAVPFVLPEFSRVESVLLLSFYAFVGFETATMPAGEMRQPKRDLPRALVAMLAMVTLIYMAVIWAFGVIAPEASESGNALADAAMVSLGPIGSLAIVLAAGFSIAANTLSGIVAIPRMAFGMAEEGMLPAWFGRVNPRWLTPANAILCYGVLAALFSLWGGFPVLAAASTLTRLLTYLVSAAALPVIERRRGIASRLHSAMALLAVCLSCWIASHASALSWMIFAALVALGTLLYFLAQRAVSPASVEGGRGS